MKNKEQKDRAHTDQCLTNQPTFSSYGIGRVLLLGKDRQRTNELIVHVITTLEARGTLRWQDGVKTSRCMECCQDLF